MRVERPERTAGDRIWSIACALLVASIPLYGAACVANGGLISAKPAFDLVKSVVDHKHVTHEAAKVSFKVPNYTISA